MPYYFITFITFSFFFIFFIHGFGSSQLGVNLQCFCLNCLLFIIKSHRKTLWIPMISMILMMWTENKSCLHQQKSTKKTNNSEIVWISFCRPFFVCVFVCFVSLFVPPFEQHPNRCVYFKRSNIAALAIPAASTVCSESASSLFGNVDSNANDCDAYWGRALSETKPGFEWVKWIFFLQMLNLTK